MLLLTNWAFNIWFKNIFNNSLESAPKGTISGEMFSQHCQSVWGGSQHQMVLPCTLLKIYASVTQQLINIRSIWKWASCFNTDVYPWNYSVRPFSISHSFTDPAFTLILTPSTSLIQHQVLWGPLLLSSLIRRQLEWGLPFRISMLCHLQSIAGKQLGSPWIPPTGRGLAHLMRQHTDGPCFHWDVRSWARIFKMLDFAVFPLIIQVFHNLER